jgi:hypothetical protein
MRPFEALLRDPWWIFTTWKLVSAIKQTYGFSVFTLVRINVRFGVMLACMFISIAFLLTDVAVNAAHVTTASGINPYWRFALVFKCASDTIFLDDFKSVLDGILARKLSSARGGTVHGRTQETRKRSFSSSMRGDPELVECAPVPGPISGRSVEQPDSGPRWSRSFNPFRSHSRNETLPKIHVQKETTVTSETREPSQDSWHSGHGLLMTPAAVAYGPRHERSVSVSAIGAGSPGSTTKGNRLD